MFLLTNLNALHPPHPRLAISADLQKAYHSCHVNCAQPDAEGRAAWAPVMAQVKQVLYMWITKLEAGHDVAREKDATDRVPLPPRSLAADE